jgi:hypothetical protein
MKRIVDWDLHLYSSSLMLTLLAVTGHNNYAKSMQLYLQLMADLPQSLPELHEHSSSGGHVVRPSGKMLAGIPSDQAIEQCMMRALNSRAGVTHARGASKSVRLTWVKTVHKCATVHSAPAELTDLQYSHDNLHHPKMGKSRDMRNYKICRSYSNS